MRSIRRTPLHVIGLLVLGSGCNSELGADGAPQFGAVPRFEADTPNNNPDQGQQEQNPNRSPDDGLGSNPELGSTLERGEAESPIVGLVTDAEGRNLPLDQLPPLENCDTPGPRTIRRLTAEQYMNSLASVFGDNNLPTDVPLQDAQNRGYNIDADDNLVQGLTAGSLNTAAEQVAASVVNDAGRFGQLTNGCTNNDDNCRRQFIRNVGEAISRDPISDERVNAYMALFGAQRDGEALSETFNEGAEMVLTAMIQSPFLLYRREIGENAQNGVVQLTGFEIASELSYFLTNKAPDGPLMEAARNGQLGTADGIQAQAERLVQTGDAQDILARFALDWLDIDLLQDKAKDGDLSVSLRDAMLEETAQLFLDTFNNGGTVADLFSADHTFLNQELSTYYGIGNVGSQEFQRVELAGTDRIPGMLGHGAFLSEHALVDNSSPVQRAFVVRERLLCNNLPEPPNDLDTNLKPGDPAATSRERYTAHSNNAVCFACHQLMDPIGFTFENYDGFGLFRDTEAGQVVDASGGVPVMEGDDFGGVTLPLNGAAELSAYLAENESVRACLANNLSYVAYGIANAAKWPNATKVCTDHSMRQFARDSGNTLSSVLTGILRAPHFTRRVQGS
jgi:hypothetical protein